MATVGSWLLGTVLMFLGFGVLACSALGSRRRSRFYIRLGGASLAMLALAFGLAFAIRFTALPQRALGPVWLALLLAALAVAPMFCYHTLAPSQGSSDRDDGGGTGSSLPAPPSGPALGGAPFPDADQSRTRRRDHTRPSPRGVSRRRAVEPVRPRAPARPRRR